MFTGRDFLNGRTITVTLQVMSDANATMQTYVQQLKANLISQTTGLGLLQLYLPGRTVQRISARVRRRAIRIDPEYTYGKATAMVEFFAPDPRVYNDSPTSAYATANSGALRTYDRLYNLTYVPYGGSLSSFGSITNAGNYETGLSIYVPGPWTSPMIQNVGTGQTLFFPGLAATATEAMTINTDLRIVTVGAASVRAALSNASQWFNAPANSITSFAISTASGSPTITVQLRDAYI
jgi:hypothetical protein